MCRPVKILTAFVIVIVGICLAGCGAAKYSSASAVNKPLILPETSNGKPKIVAFGDSLTAGFGLTENESYPYLLQQKLKADGFDYEVINAGVSGDTSQGGLERIDWVLGMDNVKILVLELGANDLLRGIPVAKMMQSEKDKLLNLEDELHKRVVGQDEAIAAVADAIRRSRAGLQDPKRPIGSFIFLGTTGVGKTELAKALAEYLFDDESMLTRIDMSEYQEKHTVSRLIGAPPGYVGYDEGGQLTEAVRRKPYSVILLDEIEKAHPDTFNVLLQVLDDGRLTDNKGRVVNFKNTIIIMTSNMGSQIIQAAFEDVTESNKEEVVEQTRVEVMNLLRQTIRPEFLNRIDEVIMFQPLLKNEIRGIIRIQLDNLSRMLVKNGIDLQFSDYTVDYLAENGFDPQFGARPLKRLIQREIVNPLSKKILAGNIDHNNPVLVDVFDGLVVFRNTHEEQVKSGATP